MTRTIAVAVLLAAAVAGPVAAAGEAEEVQEYTLLGPLRERDMTPYHLTRLEMMPAEGSAALGDGWTVESELTHTNTYARSRSTSNFLIARGGRKPVSRTDVSAFLAVRGDVFYLDGELGLLATTLHFQAAPRFGWFLTLPVFYFGGGLFDAAIERYHSAFGLPQGGRNQVARNQFRVVYRAGREQVVEYGAPASGLSDPILGGRCRLLPPASRWDLILEGAVKVAARSRGALSTGGSDVGLQLALHRTFRRQGVYLDVSAVRLGGPSPDPRADRRIVPAYVVAYELGVTRHASLAAQVYVSPSVFSRSNLPELTQTKYEIVGGIRARSGPVVWFLDLIENFIHLENTPDIGAQLGILWRPAGRPAPPPPPLAAPRG
jgi:Protein of unknown function (DUF3187)